MYTGRWKSYHLCCWRTFINAPSHTHIRWERNQPCLYRWTTEARTEGWHKKAAGNVVWWKCQTKTSRLSTVACLIKLQCCLCIRVCVPLCMCGYVCAHTHMFWQVYYTVIQRKYCHFFALMDMCCNWYWFTPIYIHKINPTFQYPAGKHAKSKANRKLGSIWRTNISIWSMLTNSKQ